MQSAPLAIAPLLLGAATPRGVHTLETSALDKNMADHKWSAAGVGPVKDGKMLLVRWKMAKAWLYGVLTGEQDHTSS